MVLNRNNVGIRDFADPDIAEFRQVVVILDLDRFAIAVGLILRRAMEEGVAFAFPVVLNDDAVEKDGDVRRANDFGDVFIAVLIFFGAEDRASEDNVVGLPFGRLTDRIHVRRELLVDRAALSFVVGVVFIRIKDLKLVVIHEENAAVSATLTFSVRIVDRRASEFEVKLATSELLFGND